MASAASASAAAATDDNYDSLLDRLRDHAQNRPNQRAVAFLAPGPNGGSIQAERTYAQLEQETNVLAEQLKTQVGSSSTNDNDDDGDVCAVLVYPPSLDFMIAFLACLKAGIVAVPVFPPQRPDSLQMFTKIVSACHANIALTNSLYNHQKQLITIKEKFSKLRKPSSSSWPEHLQWIVTDKMTTTKTSGTTTTTPLRTDNHCLAFLQFTSGSTSDPKGVMITHDNLAHNLTIITSELQAKSDTVVVSWLPQYHDMGLIGSYLGILYCGGTGYYLSPLTFLQRPSLWMEAISKYQATHLQAPNFAFALTARKFSATTKLDLSSVRHVINAAEPVDVESMQAFHKVFGPLGFPPNVIYPTYGLAEHTVFVCSGGTQILNVDKKELEEKGRVVQVEKESKTEEVSKMVGCGYPKRQNVIVKIVSTADDETTCKVLDEDVVGEIWIHSPSKAAGYYQKPKETQEDFHAMLQENDDSSKDGYLRTGDLGFLHKEELFICGRLKDLIIVGGRNYYPQDLEATAEAVSDVLRPGCSAAFTMDPTHEGGEEVALVMELKEVPKKKEEVTSICDPLANKVRAAINQEHSLGISTITFLQTRTVPKTSSGKIARAWCRKGYLAGTLKVVYQKSFKTNESTFEMEQVSNGTSTEDGAPSSGGKVDAETVRAMSKEEISSMVIRDISRVGSIPPDSIEKSVPLISIMDSITISQFKGMLENHYAVNISDEYLFRESTSVTKLVEIVKLGFAPDDSGDGEHAAAASDAVVPGQARGLAGALGCPPGVRCVIM